jgi:hypothetical protein
VKGRKEGELVANWQKEATMTCGEGGGSLGITLSNLTHNKNENLIKYSVLIFK